MRKVIIVAALLAVLGVQGAVKGKTHVTVPVTVQDYMSACKFREDGTVLQSVDTSYCAGVAVGISNTLKNLRELGLIKTPCLPDYFSPGQIVQAFLNWAKDNPKKWQFSGPVGIMSAILDTWPCKK